MQGRGSGLRTPTAALSRPPCENGSSALAGLERENGRRAWIMVAAVVLFGSLGSDRRERGVERMSHLRVRGRIGRDVLAPSFV